MPSTRITGNPSTLQLVIFLVLLIAASCVTYASVPAGNTWPGWRGDGSGVSMDAKLPLVWGAETNVVWRRPLFGEGSSSPIIWGDNAFLTASTAAGKVRLVMCINVADGTVRWQHEYTAATVPHTDPKAGFAPATPVTDGQRVYAFFDSPGLVALDMDGKEVWTLPLGPFNSPYNVANSPILYKDSVILCCDNNGDSFIMAVDKVTGAIRWKIPRKLSINFGTPLLITSQGKAQIIVSAAVVTSYDPDNGNVLWTCAGMNTQVSPSPIYDHGLVYVASGRNGPAMAIDPSGNGDVTNTHVRMHVATGGPYVVSPLACPLLMLPGDDGNIRFIDDSGTLVYNLRIRAHFTPSPILAGSCIYWVAENGDTYLIDIHGLGGKTPTASVIGVNSLGEQCLASPAVANGHLFIRTAKALYCLAGGGNATAPPARTITETFAELKTRFEQHGAADGPDIPIRLSIIEDIDIQHDPQAIPFLKHVALQDPHWDVSEAAVKALARYDDPQTAPALLAMFTDDPMWRWRSYPKVIAAQGLARLRAIEALPALQKDMSNADPMIRLACTEAVAQLTLVDTVPATTTVPSLLKMLNDADSAVREAAARSLGTLHGKTGLDRDSVIAALAKAAVDINPLVADAATASLKSFGLAPNKIGEMKMKQSIYGNPTHNTNTYNLTAGPIRLKYADGELRYLYVGEKEIVRRIYFAVRDLRFDTTMPVFTHSTVTPGKDHFTIHLEAECQSATADYCWTGDIKGSADGTITFKVSGKPNSVFTTPRIGFCVLYGAPSLAGQAYTVSDRDGKQRAGAFPTDVTPGEIEANFSSLSYTTTDGMMVSCAVSGQGFHMEDQRNFGDSSYKAYHSLAYPPNTNLTVGDVQGDTLTLRIKHATTKPVSLADTRITVGATAGTLLLPKIFFTAKPAATDTFVTINGDRKKYADVKSFTFAYNPAWHMPDEDTFMENPPAIIDQVRTARTFLPARTPMRIEPLTFDSPYPRPSRDARNQALFGAAWLTEAVANISRSGVDEVVTTVGPGPADTLIKEWGTLAGQPVLSVSLTSSLPKPVDAFSVQDGDGVLLWIVNLTDTPQLCFVHPPAGNAVMRTQRLTMAGWHDVEGPLEDKRNPPIRLEPYEVRKLTIK